MDPHHRDISRSHKTPSGLVYSWRLWRHCCCRYGWYPLVVAPIVTSGCFLSLYSSAGCDFLRVDVGFTPSNEAWNQSTAELGLFYYQTGVDNIDNIVGAVTDGCEWYGDDFSETFINEDRTWKVARIMGMISGIASLIAMTTAWLFVVSPLPASFFWPGVLLPSLMAAFLAEGSKFLFFDTSICRNTVWYPSGDESLPRVAEDCSLGATGHYAIAGGAIFFASLILVCLKAPKRRDLDTNYGTDLERNDSDVESAHGYGGSEGSYVDDTEGLYVQNISANDGQAPYAGSTDSSTQMIATLGSAHTEAQELQYSPRKSRRDDSLKGSQDSKKDGDFINPRDRYNNPGSEDERFQPSKPISNPDLQPSVVSESRLSTVEKMQNNAADGSDDLIQQFVSDLDRTFQVDAAADNNEAKEESSAQLDSEQPMILQNLCGPSDPSL